MAALTEKERLQQEIARLTGAINRQSSSSSNAYPKPRYPQQHPYRPPPFKRGNKTLLINHDSGGSSSEAGPSRSASTTPLPFPSGLSLGMTAGTAPVKGGWVKNTAKSGNKSLMNVDTYEKTEKARLSRPPPPTRKPARGPRAPTLVTSSHGDRVVIDGQAFEYDETRTKLRRVEGNSLTASGSTPSSLSMSGHQYLRTKNGNLIAAEVVRKRKSSGGLGGGNGRKNRNYTAKEVVRSKDPCRYFTKTGRCNRASTCPYVHDPTRLTICSRFLRSTCPLTSTTCPVSHIPTAHNSPSCSHFQRSGTCRAGAACLYPHVRVSDAAAVCLAFAADGWCDKGADCEERHAWECREYSEKGECRKGGKCGLMHILRAKANPVGEEGVVGMELDVTGDPTLAIRGTDAPPAGLQDATEDHSSSGSDEDADGFAGQEDFIQFPMTGDSDGSEEDEEEDEESEEGEEESDDDMEIITA